MTTDETHDNKDHATGNALGKTNEEAPQEARKPKDTSREPTPIEFVIGVREAFREIKKFIVFIRRGKNTSAALVFLTLLLAVAAFVQAVIYGLQIRPLRRSANAAASAASTAGKTLKEMAVEKRAWVGPSGDLTMTSRPFFRAETFGQEQLVTIAVEFSLNLQNYGGSPALSESDGFTVYASEEGGSTTPENWQQLICKMGEEQSKHPGSRAIFPGEIVHIVKRRAGGGVPLKHILSVWLIGCVTYRDGEGRIHHTKLLWAAVLPGQLKQELAVSSPPITWVPFTEFRLVDSDVD